MAKLTFVHKDGWPLMSPLGKKEAQLLNGNLAPGEIVLGQIIANFGQAVVATDHKVLVVKTGIMSGQSFGGKATTFDYRNISAVEVRTGFSQGELQIINPSMPSSQGNRNRDKVRIAETPNGVVFPKTNAILFNEFAAKVREMASHSHSSTTTQPAAPPTESIPDQIKQLAGLHESGALTADEFSAKKAELLRRM